ncbi:MAG: DUF1343 domain-containing protein [Erysipelotrichaceae bacterium]|nr:DUF1343 domain-containing protein [Erysipelotrichaceae bacterium]
MNIKEKTMKKYLIRSIVVLIVLCLCGCDHKEVIQDTIEPVEDSSLVLGDERFDEYLPLLKDKRVALFTNQTGILGDRIYDQNGKEIDKSTISDLIPFGLDQNGNPVNYGPHILDVLIEKGVDVRCVFSPEHGFRGNSGTGEAIDNSIDEKTGVPILSLYDGDSNYPSKEHMELFDILLADMQDIGLRYYTYYISLYYLMDACAMNGKTLIILDRPNPNGFYVDGPILCPDYRSKVGVLPIPVVYGMTWGELAGMINGEGWLTSGKDSLDLFVIPCLNYSHQDKTSLILRPSPNIKDMRAVYLYASTCFFEYSCISVGRGTDHPFEIYGSPYLKDLEGNDFTFTPVTMEGAPSPQFENEICYGRNLSDLALDDIHEAQINPEYLISAYRQFHEKYPDLPFFKEPDINGIYWIDYLSGSSKLREMIIEGKSSQEIKDSWKEDVERFKIQRRPYLIYPE